jgi:hypothetical protein
MNTEEQSISYNKGFTTGINWKDSWTPGGPLVYSARGSKIKERMEREKISRLDAANWKRGFNEGIAKRDTIKEEQRAAFEDWNSYSLAAFKQTAWSAWQASHEYKETELKKALSYEALLKLAHAQLDLERKRVELLEAASDAKSVIIKKLLKEAEERASAVVTQNLINRDGRMSNTMRELIIGMSISVDVSTCDEDSLHRYFGVVSEVMDDDGDKHGVIILACDAVPNFTVKPIDQEPVAVSIDSLEFRIVIQDYISDNATPQDLILKIDQHCAAQVADVTGECNKTLALSQVIVDDVIKTCADLRAQLAQALATNSDAKKYVTKGSSLS